MDNPSPKVDEKVFPQTAQFQKWVVEEREQNGLVDIKFFPRRIDDATVESFCGEINQMLKSPIVSDPDLI